MTCPKALESDKTPLEIAEYGHDSLGGSLTSKTLSGDYQLGEAQSGVAGRKLAAQKLPDPWLFDSEALLRELDRIRETALQVPTNGDTNATHFGLQLVVNAAWNLRENIRYILSLHREGQRSVRAKQGRDSQHQTIYDLRNWLWVTC